MGDLSEADLEERIAEVKEIKRFGEEELGLQFGDIFTEVDIEERSPKAFYWLYASLKDEITVPKLKRWTKDRPYRFYRSKSSARRRQKKLEEQGFDTHLYEGEAYGREDCPITRGLLETRLTRRADVILHEGFHITHDKREWDLPSDVEESAASYIGKQGALLYVSQHAPEHIQDAKDDIEWRKQWAQFVNTYYAELNECYEKGGDREEILARAENEAGELRIAFNPNNAYFVRARDYTLRSDIVWGTLDTMALKDYITNPDETHALILEKITSTRPAS